MSYLENVTAEERIEMVRKASEKKKMKQEWANENLKLNWEDTKHWKFLASKHQYRLPVWYNQAGSKFVNRFIKNFNLDKEWYTDYSGFKNGNEESRANPTLPAFAQIGMLLEQYDEEQETLK